MLLKLRTGQLRIRVSVHKKGKRLFPKCPKYLPIYLEWEVLSSGEKQPGSEADDWCPSSAEIKINYSWTYHFFIRLRGVHKKMVGTQICSSILGEAAI
jgi:hypothetical protein